MEALFRALLDEAILHTNTRKQFGQKLSSFCLVRHKLAKMAGKLYCLESMVYLTPASKKRTFL